MQLQAWLSLCVKWRPWQLLLMLALNGGVHVKIFKLTLFNTVLPLEQGWWVMASKPHPRTFCCHSESQPSFEMGTIIPGGQGKKMRLQKLTAKTNPNLYNQKITLGPNPHCPWDCVWNSPPLPVRGLCKVPTPLSSRVPWHMALAYEQHMEAGVTCSQKLSELVQAFSSPIHLVQREGRHGHQDTQLMLLSAELPSLRLNHIKGLLSLPFSTKKWSINHVQLPIISCLFNLQSFFAVLSDWDEVKFPCNINTCCFH